MSLKSLFLAATLTTLITPGTMSAQNENQNTPIKHVLLISVDGMHAVDYLNCSKGMASINNGTPYCPHLAALGQRGINYTAASTSRPSDSFPGLMSIVTGATPRTMGVYYDVAYDRSLDAPAKTTGNGVAGGTCVAGTTPTGTTTEYEEGIDLDQTKVNGGAAGAGLTEGGIASIDSARLPRDPARGCAPVYPWQFVRANTIFGVIHEAGGATAWSDKHPAYSSVAGRSGPGVLDDFYSPEINSSVVPLPNVQTPTGINCATVPDPGSDVTAWTNSFQNIQCYDQLKVNAILNQIAGKTHDGKSWTTPTIFGMNFQSVSVGQKLNEKSNSTKGGYLDAMATPTAALLSEIQFIDDSVGAFAKALESRGLLSSTLIIITAKHGQNPIDPNFYNPILKTGTSPATLLDNAGMIPWSESPSNPTGIGPTEDDISQLWLKPGSDVTSAVAILEDNINEAGIGEIFYGPSLALNYNKPGLGAGLDPRTPDIIVQPRTGVVYTSSTKKQEEHGGFAHDDTNVILLVSNPAFGASKTIYSDVSTSQIGPSILYALGLNPALLDGVKKEGTAILPF